MLNRPLRQRPSPQYISALRDEDKTLRNQAAQIVPVLLGRVSEATLDCLSNEDWNRLCSLPKATVSGYSE